MTPASWPCPLPGGGIAQEYALAFDHDRPARLLIVPALFDEANRLRRLTIEVMRRLDGAGVDSLLIDLPGCNESLESLQKQTPKSWREAVAAATVHFRATHVLGIRGGGLLLPDGLPGWRYAPVKGASILRQMIRARIVAAREAGLNETQDGLLETARTSGMDLAGYGFGPAFVEELAGLIPNAATGEISQDTVGGSGLWLRAEPGDSRAQADALAAYLAMGIRV